MGLNCKKLKEAGENFIMKVLIIFETDRILLSLGTQ
jgi:hypothetical protein